MTSSPLRILRLLVATGLIPLTAWLAYLVARYVDGQPEIIDNNGSGLGVLIVVASVFLTSWVASEEEWSERAAISLGLSAAFFLLSWVQFGDPSESQDASPHIVWYATCVAVFTPVVVVIAAAQLGWTALKVRRGLLQAVSSE